MSRDLEFSPRSFLRDRQAVLVHFSTIMASSLDLTFLKDLLKSKTLKGVPLSFSTVLKGDTNPDTTSLRQSRGGSVWNDH